jgi:hypothetical protein
MGNKPPPRWGVPKKPSPSAPPPRPPAPPPQTVGRVSAAGPSRRRPWLFVLAAAAGVILPILLGWSLLVGSLDRPPEAAVALGDGWTARWDKREVEIIEGILEVRDGRAVCVVHYPTTGLPAVVYRLSGRRSAELLPQIGAAAVSDETAARARYLDMLYPRLQGLLRARWEIDSREEIPGRAGDVGIRLGSALFARLEVRAARVEGTKDGRASDARREAWVDRILEVRDLS